MFEAFNSVLIAYQLNPIPTATVVRESDPTKPCIVFLSEPEKRVALLLAGGKILPNNVFIVSQLSGIKVVKDKQQNILYLLEGITTNEFGQCSYVKFKTPQKITFLCNFLTEEKFRFSSPDFQQQAQQFQDYEMLAHCPISSGVELNEYTDDKLHTRLLAVAQNIQVPKTLAFSFSLEKYRHHPPSPQVQLIDRSRNLSLAEIRAYFRDFPAEKFVIKPSGARWMGGRICTFESKDNLEMALANFQKCLDLLSPNESLLVEEFIDSRVSDSASLGARLRIFVTRRPNNVVETSGILCNLGDVAQQINGDTSESFSVNYLCDYLSLSKAQKHQLIQRLNQLGQALLTSIIDYETKYLTEIPPNKQTDFIGLDVFLKNQQGQLEPFLIEVNNHDCISTLQLYEVQHSPQRTAILDKWVETMLYRSYQYLLQEQSILPVGGAIEEKLKTVEWCNNLGIKLILCECKFNDSHHNYGHQVLEIDLDRLSDNLAQALAIIQEIRRCNLTVNGIVTFENKYLALANLIAIFLGKIANSYESASLAQNKFLTAQKIIADEFNKLTFEARKISYAATVWTINQLKDIQNIPTINYPLFLELEPESHNFSAKIVDNQQQLIAHFDEIQTVLPTEIKLGLNCSLIATSHPPGTPQNLVIILSEGKLIAAYLTPPLSTKQNFTQQKAEILPTFLDQERQENLIYAAGKVCHSLGLKEGIFYVEGIAGERGVKILGIQVCPANTDLRQWLFKVWDIDLMLYSCLIACGFKPFVNKNSRPRL